MDRADEDVLARLRCWERVALVAARAADRVPEEDRLFLLFAPLGEQRERVLDGIAVVEPDRDVTADVHDELAGGEREVLGGECELDVAAAAAAGVGRWRRAR